MKGKATVVYIYTHTRARNSSLHKHVLYFFLVCVCMHANRPGSFVLWCDALPVTHFHWLLDQSIVFAALSRHVDNCERKKNWQRKDSISQLLMNIAPASSTHICILLLFHSFSSFFFRFVHLDNIFFSHSPFFHLF